MCHGFPHSRLFCISSRFTCCFADCSIGFFETGTECEPCPVNTYSDTTGQTMCTPCGDNSNTNGLTQRTAEGDCCMFSHTKHFHKRILS